MGSNILVTQAHYRYLSTSCVQCLSRISHSEEKLVTIALQHKNVNTCKSIALYTGNAPAYMLYVFTFDGALYSSSSFLSQVAT